MPDQGMSGTSHEADRDQILLRRDEEMQVECQLETRLEAPVEEGEPVGSIRYLVNGEVFKTEILVAGKPVYRLDFPWCTGKVLDMFLL